MMTIVSYKIKSIPSEKTILKLKYHFESTKFKKYFQKLCVKGEIIEK